MSPTWIVGILLAGGEGRRFGDDLPKQFHLLSGKKLYLYALETFLKLPQIREVLLVVPSQWIDSMTHDLRSFSTAALRLIPGGSTRQHSSYLALRACPPKTSHVIIHDAVRPFVTISILKENIRLAKQYGACDTCIPSHDTLVHSLDHHTIESIPLRSHYLRGQTPQSFSYPLIMRAHEEARLQGCVEATDDCQLVLQLPHPVKIAQGSEENIKVTTPLDLLLAEQLLRLPSTPPPHQSAGNLSGKIFAVTGASGGIGTKITQHLQAAGALVLPLSRTSLYSVDLTSESAVKQIFSMLFKRYGPIDGLINAVGYLKVDLLESLSNMDIEKLIHTNFTSVVYTCKYCQIKSGGHILNLASSSYTRGRASYVIYSGMKAAIVNFTQGLALEYRHLHVNSIVPPRTDTPMRRQNFPEENPSVLLSPETVAEEVLKTLRTKNLTGMTIEIKK